MEENNSITLNPEECVQAICPTCETCIVEALPLPEGHENDEFTCPNCGTSLGVGFRVTKTKEATENK